MEQEALIAALRALSTQWGKLQEIEKAVGMPRNTLSGMLNGTRGFPKKWQQKLSDYLESSLPKNAEQRFESALAQVASQNVLPSVTSDLAAEGVAITHTSKDGAVKRIDPLSREGEDIIAKARATKRLPPPGLSKTNQIRWLRENSQTLE